MYSVYVKALNSYLGRRRHTRTLSVYLSDYSNAILFDSVEFARMFADFYLNVMGKSYKYEILKVSMEVVNYE